MKLAVVVQRYGADINGGAEQHARYIAEHLAPHHDVEVLTTCAHDYVTWRNELPAGVEQVNGIPVRRFPVAQPRDPESFGERSRQVFEQPHTLADELSWLKSEGPASPALVRAVASGDHDYAIVFSYRYYHAYHAIRAASRRTVLVPTAERDAAVGLSLFGPVFRGARALMYNSFEERAMIQAVSANEAVPGVVVGVGSELPDRVEPARFRAKYGVAGRFIVYVGRIDENKGCKELFDYFGTYVGPRGGRLSLVLIGNSILPVPAHPAIRHLGFLSDQDKFDGIAAAEALVMPSPFESLSMVTLEAWGLGRPVLANGRCDVLRGQCTRSNAGLYYERYEEFAEALFLLERNRPLNHALGHNGRNYFRRHYTWPVIVQKYLDTLEQLRADDAAGRTPAPIEPLPGWWQRRRARLPAANEVLARVPQGPALPPRGTGHGREAARDAAVA